MTSADYEYYLRRERQERESAQRTADQGARLVHLELANRYSAMLREMPAIPRQIQA
jgi:hypothetical protein